MTLDPTLLAAYNSVRHTRHTSVFCHAPFTSMNFSQNGEVTVCCYNRTYLLGIYPADDLDTMWRGPKAQHLRDRMVQNQLPAGCDLCLDQFRTGNFAGLRAQSFDHLSEKDYGHAEGRLAYPKLMELEISNVCNLECTMCNGFFSSAIRHNREKLPPLKNPYDDEFVRQMEAFIPHLEEVRFLGGEPFLVRTYYQIWDSFARLNPRIHVRVTTNGTILNDRVKRVLEALNVHVIVSIDSLEKDTYERIRVNADYDQVMANLDYFLEYTRRKKTEMTLAVCPMRQNWRDLPGIMNYCNERGVSVYFNTVWYPHDATFKYMEGNELRDVIHYLQAARLPETDHLRRTNAQRYRDMIRQVLGDLEAKEGLGTVALGTVQAANRKFLTVLPADTPRLPLPTRETALALQRVVSTDQTVQLCTTLTLKANERYVLDFRGRADAFRLVNVGVCGDELERSPLQIDVNLTDHWERFEADFVPGADASNAQLYFNLGVDTSPVELEHVVVRAMPAASGPTSHVSS